MNWKAGDKVRSRPELAHLYDGTTWAEKLSKPRTGVVVEVPMATQDKGEGTLLVKWDSLTGSDNSEDRNWTRWMYSTHVDVKK